jgi:hypothetical protein
MVLAASATFVWRIIGAATGKSRALGITRWVRAGDANPRPIGYGVSRCRGMPRSDLATASRHGMRQRA